MSFGLTVRWSLDRAPEGIEAAFRSYVVSAAHERFTGYPGLQEKYWALVPGQYVEGVYLWATAEARTAWVEGLRSEPSHWEATIGYGPDLVQEFEVVAVVAGGEGLPPVQLGAEK